MLFGWRIINCLELATQSDVDTAPKSVFLLWYRLPLSAPHPNCDKQTLYVSVLYVCITLPGGARCVNLLF